MQNNKAGENDAPDPEITSRLRTAHPPHLSFLHILFGGPEGVIVARELDKKLRLQVTHLCLNFRGL